MSENAETRTSSSKLNDCPLGADLESDDDCGRDGSVGIVLGGLNDQSFSIPGLNDDPFPTTCGTYTIEVDLLRILYRFSRGREASVTLVRVGAWFVEAKVNFGGSGSFQLNVLDCLEFAGLQFAIASRINASENGEPDNDFFSSPVVDPMKAESRVLLVDFDGK
jgi:hypothetical protein